MTVLKDHQFELLPSDFAVNGQVFGIGSDISMDADGFEPGDTSWADQDSVSFRGHNQMGRDRLLGPTWAWTLHVNTYEEADALAALGRFTTAWRAMHIRDTPGAVIPIRYSVGGRVRRIYGRPRNLSAPPDNRILGGLIPVVADFKAVDGYTYDDTVSSVSLFAGTEPEDVAFDSGGGFTFPVTFPVTTLPPKRRQKFLTVEGDAPARPIIRFNGPVTNPSLRTDQWQIGVNMTIEAGQYVTIDTRPWALSVLANGHQNLAGLLGRRQRMVDVALQPGRFNAIFNGVSPSGAATCDISWRATWNSL